MFFNLFFKNQVKTLFLNVLYILKFLEQIYD